MMVDRAVTITPRLLAMRLIRRTLHIAFVSGRTHRPLESLLRGAAAAAVALSMAACAEPLAPAFGPLAPESAERTLTGASSIQIFSGLPGAPIGDARGLNNLGQVTGSAIKLPPSPDDFRPYRWTPGSGLQQLSSICCGTAFGSDINDAGDIAGTTQTNLNEGVRAFRGAGATMVNLGILPGADREGSSKGNAINAAGQIVGSSVTASFTNHAVLWDAANAIQDLGTLGGLSSAAIDINASGQVIGTSTIAGETETHVFRWSAGSGMQDLTAQLGTLTSVIGINDAGQIAGSYTTSSGETHAFLYTPASGLRDLGTLGGTSSNATGLNNNGQVVGNSTVANGDLHDFLWTPTDGMEDITAVAGALGVPGVRLLNDKLQTLVGSPAFAPSGQTSPRLVQLVVTPNAAPVARFTFVCAGLTCTLDASTSSDDKGIVSYEWDLNKYPDGTATGVTTTVVYAHSSTRNVTLTVRDANGLTNSVTQAIVIVEPSPHIPAQ
ncbi:MAG: PKD domain-containing protein [Gemmatimonadaceae bacterium]